MVFTKTKILLIEIERYIPYKHLFILDDSMIYILFKMGLSTISIIASCHKVNKIKG